MENKQYTARKLKPANRESWVIEFRHPLAKDKKDKTGKKIRRGLGTTDPGIADGLVAQMQEILDDKTYWEPAGKSKAILKKFNEGIINAFYDEIEYRIKSHEAIRESVISIKGLSSDFAQASLVGVTGAGKTTLLRQIMGTDPKEERFPATSTAKTTVFDTEVLFLDGPYKGVVSFFTENEAREMIKDSIRNAMNEYFITNDEKQMMRVFLEDKEQKFRLSYVLGKMRIKRLQISTNTTLNDASEMGKITELEQEVIEQKLQEYTKLIKEMTSEVIVETKRKYPPNKNTQEEKDLLEEIISSEISDYDDDSLSDLTDLILEEIKERFNQLEQAELTTEKFGWPIYWKFETANREEFMNKIKYFSGNSSNMFGKLLTPLVSGMRVSGPFKPAFVRSVPKLVIYDGEGLGHIPDTSSSIPSNIISKFDDSTAIVLVDNALNPMQAPPYALIKAVSISGHYKKLSICFTHFDSVKGDNIPELEDKMEHVYGSVDNVLDNLQKDLEYDVKKYLSNHFINSTFYLANLDADYNASGNFELEKSQITALINALEKSALKEEVKDMKLTYQLYPLMYKIQNAANRFHSIWNGYLFGTSERDKAHFTQIKALSRRLGLGWANGYSFLQPISDFWDAFNTEISSYLHAPAEVPSNIKEEDRINKADKIKREVATKFEQYAIEKIKNAEISEWQEAYEVSGYGSSYDRADKIKSIYNETVPVPELNNPKHVDQFVKDIMKIITDTIEANSGAVVSFIKEG